MHGIQFLHNLIKKSPLKIHVKRLNSLLTVVTGLILGSKLSVSGLGRALNTKAKVKNNIKLVDRLVGNTKLYSERVYIYKFVTELLIKKNKKKKKICPIIVDWSAMPNPKFYLLRAAITMKGRALTLHEEVHPATKQNNHKVHNNFLNALKRSLPVNCKPIIITDAGFHAPFFKLVEALGWDWIGRIRNSTSYKRLDLIVWFACKSLYQKATLVPQFMCEAILSKTNPIQCSLFLFKRKKQGRIAKNKAGKRRCNKTSKVCAKANKEPWLLATSLSGKSRIAEKVIRLYQTRFQIEESFRDIKNERLGFSFRESQTCSAKRLEILLLIAMLAILIVTIIGKAAELINAQYDYQSNTNRKRTVLSLFFLGCQIIKTGTLKLCESELKKALQALLSAMDSWKEIDYTI